MASCKSVSSTLPLDDYAKFEEIRALLHMSRYQLVREMVQYAINSRKDFIDYEIGEN